MIQNISVPAYTINEPKTFYKKTNLEPEFPILTIDRESYIVDAKIESGINLAWEDGVYNLQIGRHSALAEEILFMIDMNHDYCSVFQGIVREVNVSYRRKIKRKGEIIIENDCWIGHGATIMGGVIVHNGAVVAANSTVTKDVPPYAIVGGNPARILKYRFNEETIKKLLKIAWWNWSVEKIVKYQEDFIRNAEDFADKFYPLVCQNTEEEEIDLNRISGGKLFIFYADIGDPFALCEKVISQYAQYADGSDCELLIYLNPLDNQFDKKAEILLNLLKYYEKYDCNVNICTLELEDDADILKNTDYYISNRQQRNIYRLCKAEQFEVQYLAGVNEFIFCEKV